MSEKTTGLLVGLPPGMNRFKKPKPQQKDEHPDDAHRASAEAAALVLIDEYFHARLLEFESLVLLYADGEAQDLFDRLREEFWGAGPVNDAMQKLERKP